MSRPIPLRKSALALALVGGAFGTAAREALGLAIPSLGGIPAATLGINLLGAFLLGALLAALAGRGPEKGGHHGLRVLLGTGFLGGFTTYSALAVDTALLLGAETAEAGSPELGLGYGLATVFLGGLTTWAGIVLGTLTRRNRADRGCAAADRPTGGGR